MLKKLFVCVLTFACLQGCTLVKPGFVAVKVNNYGTNRGVEDYPVLTGRVWYNPLTTTIYDYPTYMQNTVWHGEEKISFNTMEGSRITCDVALSYTLNAEKVPHIFVKHRQELEYITHNYLRNKVRDAINKHSAEYKAIDALSTKTQEIILNAKKELRLELEPEGFVIDTLSFVSAPEAADNNVRQSISLVISSTQMAVQAENKVKQIEAEARQAIAMAEGQAQSTLLQAKAQAESNKLLSESLTPAFIKYKMLEKWDGTAPKVMGGDAQLLLGIDSK